MSEPAFDIDGFLARPLTARLATVRPAVRPVWYLWEEGRFWVLAGPWNRIPSDVTADPAVALVVDTCDLGTGECLQVVVRGMAALVPYDQDRGRRMLERYLGSDPTVWDERFQRYLSQEPDARLLSITPSSIIAKDLSFRPSLAPAPGPH